MKKRVTWVAVAVAVAGLIGLAVWFGGQSIERRFTELSAEAEAMGMSLTMPEPEHNAEAERHRAALKEFDKRELRFQEQGISTETEDPQELDRVLAEISAILPSAYALSRCRTYGFEESPSMGLDALQALILLTPEANKAIAERDLSRLLNSTAAIRRLAHLLRRDGIVSSGTISLFAGEYCSLLQRGAETFARPDQIEAIVAEAKRWEIHFFEVAARHLAADQMEMIDMDTEPPPKATILQRAEHAAWSSKPGITKQKIFVLQQAIEVYPKWSDDAVLLKLSDPILSVYGWVHHFARSLKLRELEMRASFASLWATLHARSRVVRGDDWPTMEELAALGVQTVDPVTGKPYEWREFEGKKRLFGLNHADEGPPVERFLLLSGAEWGRSKRRGSV